ncbi:MAG: hypothetical protein RL045_1601 [Bacteroidota bacterium]
MKFYLTNILFVIALQVSAQERKPLYSISVLSPSISMENRIQENNSLKFSIGNSIGYGSTNGLQSKLFFLRGEYRHYYNLEKRRDEGRLSTHYSGNYIGLFAEPSFIFAKGEEATQMYAGGVWGIQRNYTSHFHLDLSLNAGIGQNGFETKAGVRLGFWVK